MITPIIEGMTPAQFKTAMNNNFAAIKYSATSLTTIAGGSTVSTINGNFSTILGETTAPPSMDSIGGGLRGSVYASRINGNFSRYSGANMTFTIGSGKNYTTINTAITRAISGNTLVIDAGSFDEKIDLTVKRLNLIGAANYGTTIDNLTDGLFITADIATNSTFENIVFIKRDAVNLYTTGQRPCINIVGCNPLFTNCEISRPWNTEHYSQPMTIDAGSIVTWNGGIIDSSTSITGEVNYVTVKGASTLNFTGQTFKASLLTLDTSIANIDVDYFWISDNYYLCGLNAWNNSVVNLKVNVREIFLDLETGVEGVAGYYGDVMHFVRDNSTVIVTGNEIVGSFSIQQQGILIYDHVICTYGRCWAICCGVGAVVTYKDSNIVCHHNDTTEGHHIFEGAVKGGEPPHIGSGSTLSVIDSVLNFKGYTSPYQVYGCAIVAAEQPSMIINMENSRITSEANQGKVGYQMIHGTRGRNDKYKNMIFEVLDFDGINGKYNIRIIKEANDEPVNVILEDIEFINTSNLNAIDLTTAVGVVFDENDWIKASGLINHTQQANICSDMANYNLLISQCPV